MLYIRPTNTGSFSTNRSCSVLAACDKRVYRLYRRYVTRMSNIVRLVHHCPVLCFQSTHLEELNADDGKDEDEERRDDHDGVDGFYRHYHTSYHSLKQTR